jgi:chromosome segregation and condensation protein ScpB
MGNDLANLISRIDEAKRLAEEIERLESEARQKRQVLEQLAGGLATGVAPAPSSSGIDFAEGIPLKSKIVQALRANKGKPLSAQEIARLVKDERTNTINALLARMVKKEKSPVKLVKRGRYMHS